MDTGSFNPHIQGLRALAALLVFWTHLCKLAAEGGILPLRHPFMLGLEVGQFGVDLFFVISGYLIVRSLRQSGRIGPFLARRIIRIVPLLWFINTLLLVLDLRMGERLAEVLPIYLQSCLMLPGMLDIAVMQTAAWSISYEETFYLSAALLFALSRRRPKAAVILGSGLALCLAAWHPRFAFFGVGIAALRWPVRARAPVLWLLVFLALLWAAYRGTNPIVASIIDIRPVLLATALPFAYLCFRAVIDGETGFHTMLRSWPLQHLGLVSYSFYLWQGLILDITWDWCPWRTPYGFAAYSVLALALTVGVAHLSFRVLEQDTAIFLRKRWLGEDVRPA